MQQEEFTAKAQLCFTQDIDQERGLLAAPVFVSGNYRVIAELDAYVDEAWNIHGIGEKIIEEPLDGYAFVVYQLTKSAVDGPICFLNDNKLTRVHSQGNLVVRMSAERMVGKYGN